MFQYLFLIYYAREKPECERAIGFCDDLLKIRWDTHINNLYVSYWVDVDMLVYNLFHIKRKCFLPIGLLLLGIFLSSCSIMVVEGVSSDEIDYDNYLSLKVYPDDRIMMTLKGNYNKTLHPWARAHWCLKGSR